MWAKRLGAIVLAAVLIGGALLIRRGVTGGSASPTTESPSTATAVTCVPELEPACRALANADQRIQLTVEPAGMTYERVVADPTTAPEAWVTLAPWPQMVSSAVAVSGGDDPFPTNLAVATTDLVMVGRTARMRALTEHCGTLSWRCVGDAAGQPWPSIGGQEAWGVVKPGHADAAQSAVGLLGFSTIVSDYWGSTVYTGADLENDDAFQSWLARFEAAIPTYGDAANTPLALLLAQPRLDVVATTKAEVDETAGAQASDLTVSPPNFQPRPQAELVVAGGPAADGVARSMASIVPTLSGWTALGGGRPAPPTGTGLPGPDVMIALRDLWQGVAKR
jgi:hypothetical protein